MKGLCCVHLCWRNDGHCSTRNSFRYLQKKHAQSQGRPHNTKLFQKHYHLAQNSLCYCKLTCNDLVFLFELSTKASTPTAFWTPIAPIATRRARSPLPINYNSIYDHVIVNDYRELMKKIPKTTKNLQNYCRHLKIIVLEL